MIARGSPTRRYRSKSLKEETLSVRSRQFFIFNLPLFVMVGMGVVFALAVLLTPSHLHAQEATATPDAATTATPLPKPLPVAVLTEGNATLELYFQTIVEGQFGLAHITGPGITGARARFLNQLTEFFPLPDDGFYGLLAVNMEQTPRTYELSVSAQFEDGSSVSFTTQVDIDRGDFIRQDFVVPPDRAYLIDPQIERGEFARLDSIFGAYTAEKQWDSTGFQAPIEAEFTSPFGAFRILNQTVPTRHTGWDLRAAVGTPVMASAAGKVAFAGLLDIRGNYVVIDHGYGIFTGYAHLSQTHVTRGQSIVKGQIIGASGNTGRSNGPHLHWETAINGQWVDSAIFIQTWLP
jgi:murein DD-endopeptidase MepM/ murein hydrolase activator NlpD